jgi:ribosomal protein L22
MKQLLLLAFPFLLLASGCGTAGNILNNSGMTQSEIASGLKEALIVGSQNSSNRLSAVDGFFNNSLHKIWMPPEAQKVENALRSVGLGSQVDKAILAMNRAAEEAAKSAGSIFVDAIRQMSISDAVNILRGSDTAASAFFRQATTQRLYASFQPVINNALAKTKATQYWSEVFSLYNKISTKPVTTDLSGYVTQRAIDALFHELKNEEIKIRTDPAARVTEILRKVFGSSLAQQNRY